MLTCRKTEFVHFSYTCVICLFFNYLWSLPCSFRPRNRWANSGDPHTCCI